MKRAVVVFVGIIVVAFLMVFGSPAMAKVHGACSNCHTMHSSQSPAPSEWTEKGWSAGTTMGALLVSGCVSCHTAPAGKQNDGSNDIPYVDQTDTPSYGNTGTEGDTLAGGSFYWVRNGPSDCPDGTSDCKGHNVDGISGADNKLQTPPGFDNSHPDSEGNTVGGGTWPSGKQVTCAGKFGCHGHHDTEDQFAAIRTAHHADDSTIDGNTVGTSYRMLLGIIGIECNSDSHKWEYQPTQSIHNQYYGVDGNTAGSDKRTISYLCAECHGVFHSDTGGSSPWLRHPTDFDMGRATGTEYANYNQGTGTNNPYSVVAPVASHDLSQGVLSSVNPGSADGTAIVTCISCHRAHGTLYPDLLRWNYSDMNAGQDETPNEGCFICHTTK